MSLYYYDVYIIAAFSQLIYFKSIPNKWWNGFGYQILTFFISLYDPWEY